MVLWSRRLIILHFFLLISLLPKLGASVCAVELFAFNFDDVNRVFRSNCSLIANNSRKYSGVIVVVQPKLTDLQRRGCQHFCLHCENKSLDVNTPTEDMFLQHEGKYFP